MPTSDDDERLARAAEAFLAESIARERAAEPVTDAPTARRPEARRARPGPEEAGDPPVAGDPPDRRERGRRSAQPPVPVEILDGAAWTDVVQREAARWQRHGGSVAVLAVRLARRRTASMAPGERDAERASVVDPHAAERYAVPLGDVLRHRARASDPVARVATDQFSVLLLEADEAGASAYAERIRAICEPWVNAVPGDLALRIGWAVPHLGDSFEAVAMDIVADPAR